MPRQDPYEHREILGCSCPACVRSRAERAEREATSLILERGSITSPPIEDVVIEESVVEEAAIINNTIVSALASEGETEYSFRIPDGIPSGITSGTLEMPFRNPPPLIIRKSRRLNRENSRMIGWKKTETLNTYISNCGRFKAVKMVNGSSYKVEDTKHKKLVLYLCIECFQIYTRKKLSSIHRKLVCNTCKKKNYDTCAICAKLRRKGDLLISSIDKKYYCRDCYHTMYNLCYNCRKEILLNNVISFNGNSFCGSCFNALVGRCNRCRNLSYKNSLFLFEDQLLCRNCREEHKVIKRYDYIPRKFKMNKLLWDNNLYLGIELEIETPKEEKEYYELYAKKIANFLRKNKLSKYFYLKHDGTIKGFELVSHPMTLSYIHENAEFKKVLEWLKKEGFTSYQSGNCGLHVHLNKSFLSYKDVNKLRLFFSINQLELAVFSKRQGMNGGYCRYETFNIKNFLKNVNNCNRQPQENKYYAFRTNPMGKNTVEMRIFRGTLDIERFIATLQFCDALAHYSKEVSIMSIRSKSSWNNFLMWSKKTCRYNHFINYIDNVKNLSLIET